MDVDLIENDMGIYGYKVSIESSTWMVWRSDSSDIVLWTRNMRIINSVAKISAKYIKKFWGRLAQHVCLH